MQGKTFYKLERSLRPSNFPPLDNYTFASFLVFYLLLKRTWIRKLWARKFKLYNTRDKSLPGNVASTYVKTLRVFHEKKTLSNILIKSRSKRKLKASCIFKFVTFRKCAHLRYFCSSRFNVSLTLYFISLKAES